VTPAELQAAMDAVPRPMPYTPWWAVSTLRPSIPSPQVDQNPHRAGFALSRDVVADPDRGAPIITEAPVVISTGGNNLEDEPVLLGGVTATLDITIWRTRFFWRLLVKAAIRRLGRALT
jgi:hypothetical protein